MTNVEPSMPYQDASMPSGFSMTTCACAMTNLMGFMLNCGGAMMNFEQAMTNQGASMPSGFSMTTCAYSMTNLMGSMLN